VFERLPTHGYQVLRDQLNVAMRSIQIHQSCWKKPVSHERDELERLATSKRLESLSVLAAGGSRPQQLARAHRWRFPIFCC